MAAVPTIEQILQPYRRFGVNLGLVRIEQLLASLGNPQHRVPIVHVAGTNGKGSVCAYLSSVLSSAGYRVGRYTSPHLVDWPERICLNEEPISTAQLRSHLQTVIATLKPDQATPTQFEILTAAAWVFFAEQAVDIAIIEVGLGGRLDATNVCDQPLVTVITSLSREHWQTLGPTLSDIAREKAGILKAGRPTVVGPLSPEAQQVVQARANELGCDLYEILPAQPLVTGVLMAGLPDREPIQFQPALLGEHQWVNGGIAIATLQLLQAQGWQIPLPAIQQGMAQAKWPGRLQWVTWQNHPLLVDGAHNPAAAQALRHYIDGYVRSQALSPSPVVWLMGMLVTKDHQDIFQALLRPGDQLHLVPVPEHLSAVPSDLAKLAQEICPNLSTCQVYPDLFAGLKSIFATPQPLVVLCGSLYLIGSYYRQLEADSVHPSDD